MSAQSSKSVRSKRLLSDQAADSNQSFSESSATNSPYSKRTRTPSANAWFGDDDLSDDDDFPDPVDQLPSEEEQPVSEDEIVTPQKHSKKKHKHPNNVLREIYSDRESDDDTVAASQQNLDETVQKTTTSKKEKAKRPDWSEKKIPLSTPLPRFRNSHPSSSYPDLSPFSLFQLMFTDEWTNRIIDFMNRYSLKKYGICLDTCADEFHAFIAVYIYMGIYQLPEMHVYFGTEQTHPFVTSLFSRDRFKSMNACFVLHLDPDNTVTDDPGIHCYDFISHFNNIMPTLYVPGFYLTFDESMVHYTGRSPIKQFMMGKPHPFGYKVWALAHNAIVLQIELFEGKNDEKSEDGKMRDLIRRMSHLYRGSHRILFCDQAFTSPILLTRLREMNLYVCGSIQINRTGMPPPEQIKSKNLKRFESAHFQNNDMALAVWIDKNEMRILYNHISPTVDDAVVVRYQDHEWIDVPCPKAVEDYFKYMRSVDVFNQLHYSYPIGRKNRYQRTRMVWWLVDLCIVNAYLLYRKTKKGVRQLFFRKILYKELASAWRQHKTATQASQEHKESMPIALEHYSSRVDEPRVCVICSQGSKKRVRTRFVCKACNKHMCLDECFVAYHRNITN